MNRKLYRIAAEQIAKASYPFPAGIIRDQVIERFIEFFASQNPKFDRCKFIAECRAK